MALRGTLKDFGIADIFQLIGHQGKSGILTVRNRDQEVKIHFAVGSIARAESATRHKKDLLGAMLVRAEVVSEAQLAQALAVQKNTLRRLGDVLLEQKAVDEKSLRAFAKLQTTETIYRLFLWDSGTYEFEQAEIATDPGTEAIRSENVLMEGFRQVDEWPGIRRKITGYSMSFERREDLDALTAQASGAGDDDFDAAFGEFEEKAAPKDDRLKDIGQNERIVYQLIKPERDVQKIIDLSRLGEFETCKALVTLMTAGIIAPLVEAKRKPSAEATVGGIYAAPRSRWVPAVTRVLVTAALLGVAAYGAYFLGVSPQTWLGELGTRTHRGYVPADLQAELSRGSMARIREAL
ncbi:MAG: DUF4388 domain-containing protein, partial [Deltaproteobacteria bacterium]|nr:DUF4388 domain-containing protein [Deltaproteobacteria bacterium]